MTITKEDVAKVEAEVSVGAKIVAAILSLFGIKAKKGPNVDKIK
jgi:hypothetical protein